MFDPTAVQAAPAPPRGPESLRAPGRTGWIRRRAALAKFRAIPDVAAVILVEELQNAGLVHKQGGGAQSQAAPLRCWSRWA